MRREKPAEELTPLTWHSVLQRPPTELLWPHERGESTWTFNAQRQELAVNCRGKGLLGLGEVRRAGYQMRVNVNQNGWTGGIGIFFGYAADVCDGTPCVRYQFLELRPYLPRDPARAFAVCRGLEQAVPDGKGGHRFIRRDLASAPLPRPNRQGQLLDLEVGRPGLVTARWDGLPLTALTAPAVNAQLKESDYVGEFGTLNFASGGEFRNYEVMLFEVGR
jgi:hypothetical protein